MPHLITTLGPKKSLNDLGMILPHQHVFVDLRTWDQPGYGEADATFHELPKRSGATSPESQPQLREG